MSFVSKLFRPQALQMVEYAKRMRLQSRGKGTFVFIASMPKSGSTFMARVMEQLTGYPYVALTYGYERDEQNLYLPTLIDTFGRGSVTHQHVRATGPNLELMREFKVRPVILTRNLFDVVISIRDHLLSEGPEFPTFYCDNEFVDIME